MTVPVAGMGEPIVSAPPDPPKPTPPVDHAAARQMKASRQYTRAHVDLNKSRCQVDLHAVTAASGYACEAAHGEVAGIFEGTMQKHLQAAREAFFQSPLYQGLDAARQRLAGLRNRLGEAQIAEGRASKATNKVIEAGGDPKKEVVALGSARAQREGLQALIAEAEQDVKAFEASADKALRSTIDVAYRRMRDAAHNERETLVAELAEHVFARAVELVVLQHVAMYSRQQAMDRFAKLP